jgi:hypothetical protein
MKPLLNYPSCHCEVSAAAVAEAISVIQNPMRLLRYARNDALSDFLRGHQSSGGYPVMDAIFLYSGSIAL